MWFAVFYNVSVRKASKALIMRDYDTTNITLIRQLIKMVGSDYRSACRNRRQKQIYGLNNNQARDTTMKNLWKRQPRKSCQFKALVTKRMTCFYLMCRFLEVRGT